MKKFYSVLALAAAACLSAQAADVKNVEVLSKAAAETATMETIAPAPQKAPAKAPAKTIEELQGRYSTTYYGALKGQEGLQAAEFAIVPSLEGGNNVEIYGLNQVAPIPATVDFAAGTITLPGSYSLGEVAFSDGDYEVVMVHKRWNDNGQGSYDANTTPIIWNIVDGGIKADDLDIILFSLPDIPGSYLSGAGGYAFELVKIAEEDASQWYTAGEATIADDGWFMPIWNWAYFGLSSAPTLTCEFQLSKTNPDVVALNNPYGGLNAIIQGIGTNANGDDISDMVLNEGNLPGRVVINVANRECVYVYNQYLGVISDGTLFFGSNSEGIQIEEEGATTEDLLFFLEGKTSTYDAAAGLLVIKNALFTGMGFRNKSMNDILTSKNSSESVTIMISEIDPSGLVNIAADQNAPVEYFNLQGMKVENPAAGLYIKRQGNTVTKVVL